MVLSLQPTQPSEPAEHCDARLLGMTIAQHMKPNDSVTIHGVNLRMHNRQYALLDGGYLANADDLRRLAAVLNGMARMMEIGAPGEKPAADPPIAIPPVPPSRTVLRAEESAA